MVGFDCQILSGLSNPVSNFAIFCRHGSKNRMQRVQLNAANLSKASVFENVCVKPVCHCVRLGKRLVFKLVDKSYRLGINETYRLQRTRYVQSKKARTNVSILKNY